MPSPAILNTKKMKKILLFTLSLVFYTVSLQSVNAQGCAEPSGEEGVQVFGYIQPEFNLNQYSDPTTTRANDYNASFRFRRARIGVMGSIPYDFSYYVLLETSQWLNPNETGPFLLDAFVSYTRFNYFKISVGSFKYRFGRELSMACNNLYTIRRSRSIDELTANFNGGNRDLGVMILGGNDTTLFTYQVSLTNGYGVLDTKDNDLTKALSATSRITVQPLPGLSIGASYRHSFSPPSSADVTTNDTKDRWGIDAQYTYKNFTILGEYIDGRDEGSYTEGGGCDGNPVLKNGFQNADGFFVMGIYRLNKFEPVYKFENYSTSKGATGETVTADANSFCHTFGLNFYPNDWTRIQANYIYASEDPTEIPNDALLIQLQVKF